MINLNKDGRFMCGDPWAKSLSVDFDLRKRWDSMGVLRICASARFRANDEVEDLPIGSYPIPAPHNDGDVVTIVFGIQLAKIVHSGTGPRERAGSMEGKWVAVDSFEDGSAPQGRHFKGSAPRPCPAASVRHASPDETSVYLDAARVRVLTSPGTCPPPSPDETASFMIAAGYGIDRVALSSGVSLLPAQEDACERPACPSGTPVAVSPIPSSEDSLFSQPVGGLTDAPVEGSCPVADEDGDLADGASHAGSAEEAEKNSNMVSVLVMISRVTGFVRTSAQAWALGITGLASTYTVAVNMPNVLYELVMGGMLITSFLPVYLSVKKRAGQEGAVSYASNLISIVLLLMGVLTVASFIFAVPIIWTQTAGATDGFDFDLSVWFFRWFVCEIVLYALSSLISGVLNAERDYWVSNVAPILNNLITISSFAIYGYLVNVAGVHWSDAVIVLAIGNPLGVAAQVVAQIPALRRHGVRLRLRVDLRDPALRETLSIGLPTLVVTFASFPTTAVMSSCALSVTAAGASISYYSRVWYVLPFSIFAIPISVTLFTELSSCRVAGDHEGYITCLAAGARKIMFTLIPFAMYLVVFAPALIAVFATGKFTSEASEQAVGYLRSLALALPFYGLSSYLQKACSSLLKMKFYAVATCIAAAIQIVLCLWLTPKFGLYVVPISSTFFYGTICVVTMLRLRAELGGIELGSVAAASARAVVFGALGSAVGFGILAALVEFAGPCEGLVRGVLYAAAGGLPALIVTFGLASVLKMSDAPFFEALFSKLLRRSATELV